MYDFIIKNGSLVDFATGETRPGDVYVKNGRIVPPGSHGPDEAAEIFDATGKYVLPGLIDSHAHVHFDGNNGAHADILCPPSGVTTVVDGGSTGWQTYPLFGSLNPVRYMTTVKSFLHLAPFGVIDTLRTETHDPADFDEEKILRTVANHPDDILGLKIRMDARTLERFGTQPLEKAVAIADKANAAGFRCIINAHYANLPDGLDVSDILATLRPGDIFVHAFQNRGQTIFDADGNVFECAKIARKRGVIFDCCTGRIHWSFANIANALVDGFPPDIISSDIIRESCFVKPGFSLIHAMTAFLACGMNEVDILRTVTVNPARLLGLNHEAGSLEAGRRADIAVMDVVDGSVPLFDRFGGAKTASRIFLPLMTVKNGEIVFRQIFF